MSWKAGDWGYCKYCKFLIPLQQTPLLNAGCLEPHLEWPGFKSVKTPCGYEARLPDTLPKGGILPECARLDKQDVARIKKINKTDPRDD